MENLYTLLPKLILLSIAFNTTTEYHVMNIILLQTCYSGLQRNKTEYLK